MLSVAMLILAPLDRPFAFLRANRLLPLLPVCTYPVEQVPGPTVDKRLFLTIPSDKKPADGRFCEARIRRERRTAPLSNIRLRLSVRYTNTTNHQ